MSMTKLGNNSASDPGKKISVIFVVNLVLDRPSQVRYQRILALSTVFNVIVVSRGMLPRKLKSVVTEVYKVDSVWKMWAKTLDLARLLTRRGGRGYVHTQYSLDSMFAGYLCKKLTGYPWIYDLWDHPSLSWARAKGPSRWLKQFFWFGVKHLLRNCDAWIVAMNPGVLGHLPSVPISCRLIWSRPGCLERKDEEDPRQAVEASQEEALNVVYSGSITWTRGIELIKNWAKTYTGPSVNLHLLGNCDKEAEPSLSRLQDDVIGNMYLKVKIWGELPYNDVLELLKLADIGLCPLDPKILNYRYAYPVKIMEYMSLRLVVVATDGHGVRSLVTDGRNGFIGSYDNEGFRKAIGRAISLCDDMSAKKRMLLEAKSVVDKNSWDHINHNLIGQLSEVLLGGMPKNDM